LGLLLAGRDAARRLGPAGRGPAGPVGPLLGDAAAAGDAVAVLRRYSLATAPAGDGLVQVHRLVQAITPARKQASGNRPQRPWSRRRSRPTASCRGRGRPALCCCRTSGPCLT
jgi:hypothetical protein